MIFGICTAPDEDGLIPHLSFIVHCGFDYVELPLNTVALMDKEKFSTLQAQLVENKIPCTVCNCFMPSDIKMTGDEYNPNIFEKYVKTAVERAKALGCRKLVLGSGASRNIPSGYDSDAAYRQFDERIDFIVRELEKNGMQLELEHLNRLESNIMTSFDETTAFVDKKANPQLKSILDYFHFAIGNENTKLITERCELIGHIHFARPLGRVFPEMADMAELYHIIKIISDIGYDDTFSMECTFPDMEQEPEKYREILLKFKEYLN